MDKKLETRLRLKVRRLVESILGEEGPMPPPADDFKPNPARQSKTVTIGSLKVNIGNLVIISDVGGTKKLAIKKDDAIKLAEYLYRVLGKV